MNNSEGAVSRSIIKIKLFVIKSYRRTALMWHLHNTGTATGASALHTPPCPLPTPTTTTTIPQSPT